jgi:hypothetical protein
VLCVSITGCASEPATTPVRQSIEFGPPMRGAVGGGKLIIMLTVVEVDVGARWQVLAMSVVEERDESAIRLLLVVQCDRLLAVYGVVVDGKDPGKSSRWPWSPAISVELHRVEATAPVEAGRLKMWGCLP